MAKHGGKRNPGQGKTLGRNPGKTTDNVKMGISIRRANAEWLKAKKSHGFNISRLIDKALDALRELER